MAVTPRLRALGTLLAGALLLLIPALAAAGLSEAELRGRRIYREGQGRGSISAFLVGPRIKAPGSAFPCVSCHLGEGPGTREGGVQSSDITYTILAKQHEGVRPSGRAHPPYADDGLKRAVTAGIDPAGTPLHDAHPRYAMSPEDLEDLIAYLKILGREPVPGVTDTEVRVGILLPDRGPLSEAATLVRRLLLHYFDEVNARGGLFRRALVLVPVFFDPTRQGALAATARDLVEKEDVLCLLANLGVPPEDEGVRVLSAANVPVIAPLLIAAHGGYGTDRSTFHIYASVRDQARVMVDFLARDTGRAVRSVALLYASDKSGEAGAAGAREQTRKHALSLVSDASFPPGGLSAPGAVERLKAASPDAVLFFGAGADAVAFLGETARQRWRPLFLAPASMVGHSLLSLPVELAEEVYLASPVLSPDPGSPEMARFIRLTEKSGAPGEHRSFQLLGYAGAKLLEEGLRRSGRDVNRNRLVDVLGSLWAFPTGVTPPMTYNENRRVGAVGAQILKLDSDKKRLTVAAPWREPR